MTFEQKIGAAFAEASEFALVNLVWYGLAAGVASLTLYVILRRALRRRKIIPHLPSFKQQRREVYHSLVSVMVFGSVVGTIVFASNSGLPTRLYSPIDKYGWGWYVATLVMAIFVQDAYFYWTHRLLHHRALFRRMHRVHHLSTNPTPWAAYSFNVGEAYVHAGIAPLLLYTIPMHYSAFLAFMLWQVVFNVIGHCGYELFPHRVMRTWAGTFVNTPTHHVMHHEKINGNFGLYFNYWDRLFKTNHADYEERFEALTATPRGSQSSGTGVARADRRVQPREHRPAQYLCE